MTGLLVAILFLGVMDPLRAAAAETPRPLAAPPAAPAKVDSPIRVLTDGAGLRVECHEARPADVLRALGARTGVAVIVEGELPGRITRTFTAPSVEAAVREVPVVHEHLPVLKALEQFRSKPVRLAFVIDEYGGLEGIVTQTDLLEAFAGEIPDAEGEEPMVTERHDGSLLIDGSMAAHDAFDRLALPRPQGDLGFHTLAGFAISRIGRSPETGARFAFGGWTFEIVDMDGLRIDKLLAVRGAEPDVTPLLAQAS